MHTANIIVLITTMISLQYRIPGLFVPLHFRSRERKVHRENFRSRGTFVPWNIRSLELLLLWNTFVPRERKFQELSFRGTFAPVELSFLGSERFKNFRSYETVLSRERIFPVVCVCVRHFRKRLASISGAKGGHGTEVLGTFAPEERKFQGCESSMERKFLDFSLPGSECSTERKFHESESSL